MEDWMAVADAARDLGVSAARVRILIHKGALQGEWVAGRWLVSRRSVVERRGHIRGAGRPMAPRNAWALLLLASGEDPPQIPAMSLWRARQALIAGRVTRPDHGMERRAAVNAMWAVPGELRPLAGHRDVVMSGSSAAGAYGLELLNHGAMDAYVPAGSLARLVREHDLEPAAARDANVTLRVVPDGAWMLDGRGVAPRAAVAVDLAEYSDPRSQRVGRRLLGELARVSVAPDRSRNSSASRGTVGG